MNPPQNIKRLIECITYNILCAKQGIKQIIAHDDFLEV